MSSYAISLRDLLKNKDEKLHSQLLLVKDVAEKLLIYTQSKFPYYTPHGFTHSQEVENCLNWLIPEEIKENFNSFELFFIILGAWLHDWGMIGREDENQEEIRENHQLRTEEFVNKDYDKIHLSVSQAPILGKICRGHRKEDLNSPFYNQMSFGQGNIVNVRFLSALVRIADEFEITANRVPEIIYYSLNPSSQAREEFEKHLRVTGIAYESGEVTHKVIISATVRDPKGAETIEKVGEKLQNTLNGVKNILSANGMNLEYVEVRITAQGFIHSPIKYKIDERRIVEILIGEHLYRDKDVALRELIQNSIDACGLKQKLLTGKKCQIFVKKTPLSIEINDDGIGMDFYIAKQFLSRIGNSFYTSENYSKILAEKKFNPISKFGIGFLSSFLISKIIFIETMKDGSDPCKFTIYSADETWKYEKGSMTNSGTKISLELKKEYENINILSILDKYFIKSTIPIFFQENNSDPVELQSHWDLKTILERHSELGGKIKYREFLKFTNKNFELIIGDCYYHSGKGNMFLFNQGIFVDSMNIVLGRDNILCVNLKTRDIVDLNISREKVQLNDKWFSLLNELYIAIFRGLLKKYGNPTEEYFTIVKTIIDSPAYTINLRDLDEIRAKNLIILAKVAYKEVFFPIFENKVCHFKKIMDIKNQKIVLYQTYAPSVQSELKIIEGLIPPEKIMLINICRWQEIKDQNGKLILNFKEELTNNYNINILQETNFYQLIGEKLSTVNLENLNMIVKENIFFAHFPEGFSGIVIIKNPAKIILNKYIKGSAYWGTALFFRAYFKSERLFQSYKNADFERFWHYDYIEMKEIHQVFINIDDPFINVLSNLDSNIIERGNLKELIQRYFKLISFLPLIISNLVDNLVFLNLIDDLENDIIKILNKEPIIPLLQRIGKIGLHLLKGYEHSEHLCYETEERFTEYG